MNKDMAIINMRTKKRLKNAAKRAAKAEELSLTQWINRAIAARLLEVNK